MIFLAAMAASLLDPLRLIAAIASGFVPKRAYALVVSVACSLGWSLIATALARQEQSNLRPEHWIAAAVTAVMLTAFVHWLRHRKRAVSPPATNI